MDNNQQTCRFWLTNFLILCCSSKIMAAQPLLSVSALYKAPARLASNSFTSAMYLVTNNTKTLTSFTMQPIQGVTQITTVPGACGNPIVLSYGQSCQLDLQLVGSKISKILNSGPVICNTASQPMSCSQPSASDAFNVQVVPAIAQNTWIDVLIAQDPPLDDLSTYMNKIISLAPNMTQLHLNIPAGATNYSLYSDLMHLMTTAYGPSLKYGYHPDNSDSSYTPWNCPVPSSPAPPAPSTYSNCVLNASIQNLNEMNAVADPQHTGQGFSIFSLEQDDVELVPSSTANFSYTKSCLNAPLGDPSYPCPAGVTLASPVVLFGDVTQSYGVGYYGPTMLDYAYPQFYNLGKNIQPNTDLITSGFFPPYSTQGHTSPFPNPLYVVDVDQNNAYTPVIPNFGSGQTYPDVYTYLDPSTSQISPNLVASYMSYLMTQYPPIAVTIPLSGSTAYITFSGEDFVFGAPGWNLAAWNQFYTLLYTDFTYLQQNYPSLFPQVGTSPIELKYAIWNFSSMLDNITL